MADITYDDVVKLAEQLQETDQDKLISHLRARQNVEKDQVAAPEPTREALIQELYDLRATGVFDNMESLYGKYANPNVPDVSEAEFHADLHLIASEWEQELDEFDPAQFSSSPNT